MKKLFYALVGVALTFLSVVAVAETAALITGVQGPDADFLLYVVGAWSELSVLTKTLAVFWLLVPVFSLIVALTPTPRDDAWWGKYIYPALEWLALNFLKSKQKPGDNDLLKPLNPRNYEHRQ